MVLRGDARTYPNVTDMHVSHLAADMYDLTPEIEALLMHGAFALIASSMGYDANRKQHFAQYLINRNRLAQQHQDPNLLIGDIRRYLRMYPKKLARRP